jgi:3-carboxy-cis,cis-muconate cycloisomerase
MLRNIDALQGLVFAEAASMQAARHIGKARAHAWLERLSQETVASGRHLRDLTLESLANDPSLAAAVDADEMRRLFDPAHAAQHAIDVARPQLAALRAQATALAHEAPWGGYIPAE